MDRLENIAFVTARAHQNFISTQFLDTLDLYVSEKGNSWLLGLLVQCFLLCSSERTKCGKLPELSSNMKELLSADAPFLPDELFRLVLFCSGLCLYCIRLPFDNIQEMQTAGRLELKSSQESGSCAMDETIDLVAAGDSDCEDDEETEEQGYYDQEVQVDEDVSSFDNFIGSLHFVCFFFSKFFSLMRFLRLFHGSFYFYSFYFSSNWVLCFACSFRNLRLLLGETMGQRTT